MARSRPGSRPAQTRSASTMAAPVRHAPSPQQQAPPHQNHYSHPPATTQQSQQPGIFSQMASTAAGVAVGSAVGHTIGAGLSGMFGSSSSAPEQQQQQQVAPMESQAYNQNQMRACDMDARNFTRCLDENNGNFQICDYYLQQLKACQEAARQY
ncbi:normal oxygen consumption protein [Zygosaccharomyces mellis]|uniref:Normal oxygen consumption protein n=1 Tax=Zygosaccharomyces mellis TaxID=42258 RepID=A0A4C2E450_9SACH|nr:normal oxygen consumption protein [Zygosaccharomyces mellis]